MNCVQYGEYATPPHLFLVVLVARIHVEQLVTLVLEETEGGAVSVFHHGLRFEAKVVVLAKVQVRTVCKLLCTFKNDYETV